MILNFVSGIIGGIWLALLGNWSLLGYGLATIIFSSALLGIALLPGLAFAFPATIAAERNRLITAGLFAVLGNIWTYGVLTTWCVGSFILIIADHKSGSLWPYLLWSYSVATGPWTYLAAREAQSDPNSFASTTAFAACLGAIAMMVVAYVKSRAEISLLIEAFSIPIVPCFMFQVFHFISAAKHQRRRAALDNALAKKYAGASQPQLNAQIISKNIEPEKPIAESEPIDPKAQSENTWYVFVNGKELGPAKFNDLAQLANKGVLHKSVQMRRSDSEKWVTAGEIEGLFILDVNSIRRVPTAGLSVSKTDRLLPEEETAKLRTKQKSTTHIAATRNKWNNYIARHWRGELSLPVSYWINGFLGNIIAVFVIAGINAGTDIKNVFRPELALLSIILIWFTALSIFVWQIVGVWRSAKYYKRTNHTRSWGGVAQFVMVIALFRSIASFGQTGVPQIIEYYKIFAGDEEVGKYAFRVLRDGQELEFSGGITFGAAKEFERFINAMGAVKLVHLSSLGGRISEAQRIGDIIKKNGLNTYVSNGCMSACTIIFLSGRERFIHTNSRIGFHQPDFPGMTDEDRRNAVTREEKRLQELGVSAAFARKANLASPDTMWFPTSSELLSERVATKLVNSSDFAMSGLDPVSLKKEQLNETLSNIEIYESIRTSDPRRYAKILELFENGIQRGRSVSDLKGEIAPLVVELFNKSLPYTSDENLLSFARFAIKLLSVYNSDNPSACYFYANPKKVTSDILVAFGNKYKELATEELQLESKIIKGYSGKSISVPNRQSVATSLGSVVLSLQNRNIDLGPLNEDNVKPDKYYSYCTGLIALYEETLKLPKKEAVALMRYLMAQE